MENNIDVSRLAAQQSVSFQGAGRQQPAQVSNPIEQKEDGTKKLLGALAGLAVIGAGVYLVASGRAKKGVDAIKNAVTNNSNDISSKIKGVGQADLETMFDGASKKFSSLTSELGEQENKLQGILNGKTLSELTGDEAKAAQELTETIKKTKEKIQQSIDLQRAVSSQAQIKTSAMEGFIREDGQMAQSLRNAKLVLERKTKELNAQGVTEDAKKAIQKEIDSIKENIDRMNNLHSDASQTILDEISINSSIAQKEIGKVNAKSKADAIIEKIKHLDTNAADYTTRFDELNKELQRYEGAQRKLDAMITNLQNISGS